METSKWKFLTKHQLSSPEDQIVVSAHKLQAVRGSPENAGQYSWYQEKEGEPLKRILYGSANSYKLDKPNSPLGMDNKKNGILPDNQ